MSSVVEVAELEEATAEVCDLMSRLVKLGDRLESAADEGELHELREELTVIQTSLDHAGRDEGILQASERRRYAAESPRMIHGDHPIRRMGLVQRVDCSPAMPSHAG